MYKTPLDLHFYLSIYIFNALSPSARTLSLHRPLVANAAMGLPTPAETR